MGNVCCKPKKAPLVKKRDEPESSRPLDNTQSIFVKSKIEKFKRHTKIVDEDQDKGNRRKIDIQNVSESDSGFEVKVHSSESYHLDLDNRSRLSASRSSIVSKSMSASQAHLENIHLMKRDQFKKGKVISENKIKTIYQCMHTDTGKLLISKTYRVRIQFTSNIHSLVMWYLELSSKRLSILSGIWSRI